MEINLWCVLVFKNGIPAPGMREPPPPVGSVARVVIKECGNKGQPKLALPPNLTADDDFVDAITQAYRLTNCTVGWPENTSFEIGIEPGASNLKLPAPLKGNSHFGAIAIGLAQAVALTLPSCRIRSGAQALIPMLQLVCLGQVAVSASPGENMGDFEPVGFLESKLRALGTVGLDPKPVVCVIAKNPLGQEEEKGKSDCGHEPEIKLRTPISRGLKCLPVRDSFEAFHGLWEAQTRTLATLL